eukprot:CAMPEP_0169123232 /NCGR_PEP_ID=MMETSP1015-20121227/33673_1 /TAXON_ID=342587 /ORGANISM="Karlodinium micrum, Strain CCMP2283" /LENGTH=118 /DNA_ID=CAMNT_0009186551 /DNA_START=123 /DNA_END=479 /DNA_ORIENTATION=-
MAAPLGRDHIMLQAGYETSKAKVVKKAPALDGFDDDEDDDDYGAPGLDGTCTNFGCEDGPAINIVSKGGMQNIHVAKPALSKAPALAQTEGSHATIGTSRFQKGTKMSKVVLSLEEDD